MKNLQVTRTGLVIVNKNNRINVYTLNEYTNNQFYKKLYKRIYQFFCMLAVMFIPALLIKLFK